MWNIFAQSIPDWFLCSLEHSKVCFELLKILRAAQNALPLLSLRSRKAFQTCGAFL